MVRIVNPLEWSMHPITFPSGASKIRTLFRQSISAFITIGKRVHRIHQPGPRSLRYASRFSSSTRICGPDIFRLSRAKAASESVIVCMFPPLRILSLAAKTGNPSCARSAHPATIFGAPRPSRLRPSAPAFWFNATNRPSVRKALSCNMVRSENRAESACFSRRMSGVRVPHCPSKLNKARDLWIVNYELERLPNSQFLSGKNWRPRVLR